MKTKLVASVHVALALYLCLMPVALLATETRGTYVPLSPATVASGTVLLGEMGVSNDTAGAITLQLLDRTTDCGGAGCPIFPTVSVAAHTKYAVDFKGEVATNGFTWVASGSGLYVWISYGNR